MATPQQVLHLAKRLVAYCANTEDTYQNANLDNLRAKAKRAIEILDSGADKASLASLLAEMETDRHCEGSGYYELYLHLQQLIETP